MLHAVDVAEVLETCRQDGREAAKARKQLLCEWLYVLLGDGVGQQELEERCVTVRVAPSRQKPVSETLSVPWALRIMHEQLAANTMRRIFALNGEAR
jgi:hypothetical protein